MKTLTKILTLAVVATFAFAISNAEEWKYYKIYEHFPKDTNNYYLPIDISKTVPVEIKDTLYFFLKNNLVLLIAPDTAIVKQATDYFPDLTVSEDENYRIPGLDLSYIYINWYFDVTKTIIRQDKVTKLEYIKFEDQQNAIPLKFKYYTRTNGISEYINATEGDPWVIMRDTNKYSQYRMVTRLVNDTFVVKHRFRMNETLKFQGSALLPTAIDDAGNLWVASSDTLMVFSPDGSSKGIDIETLPANSTDNSFFICTMTKCKDGVAFMNNVGDLYIYNSKTESWTLDTFMTTFPLGIECAEKYPYVTSDRNGKIYAIIRTNSNSLYSRSEDGEWSQADFPPFFPSLEPIGSDQTFSHGIYFDKNNKMILITKYNVAIQK